MLARASSSDRMTCSQPPCNADNCNSGTRALANWYLDQFRPLTATLWLQYRRGGQVIATGGKAEAVRLWNVQLTPLAPPLIGDTGQIMGLTFRTHDQALISAGYDGKMWLSTGLEPGHGALVPTGRHLVKTASAFTAVSISPDG
jgi:hypothetical protein